MGRLPAHKTGKTVTYHVINAAIKVRSMSSGDVDYLWERILRKC